MTVLIVDDNPAVRRILRRALQLLASDIWECDDGDKSLEQYREHHPTWVLMDLNMPKMDGLTAARLIRQFDDHAKIVVVTDFDDDDTRAAAHHAGATAFLSKQDLTPLEELLCAGEDRTHAEG